MFDPRFAALAAWITDAGLEGASDTALLRGFCERAVAAGLPLATVVVLVDTLHPIHEGHALRWTRGGVETTRVGYGRTSEGEAAASWRRTSFFQLLDSGETLLRWRLTPDLTARFPNLARECDGGMTECLGLLSRFAAEGIIGEMDGIYTHWFTDAPDGFADADVDVLRRLAPFLAIAIKCSALAAIAATLLETYLGRDAGRLVLRGRIARGVADRIEAVLWFSDLRGYTRITETAPPEEVIPLLNDYADVVVSAVHEHDGDVLKLIGDGVLAIFRADDVSRACRAALEAALEAERSIAALNARRAADGLPTTEMYLGLHLGEVFFGNVGSADRLDFTVVGPAVNEASRIAAMCRSVDQSVLTSAAFARALDGEGARLVSVGRYALRGVPRPQELFTVDRDASID